MKSITPVVSIILLITMTLVAAGGAFFFINSNIADLQAQGSVDTYPGMDNSKINLVSITGSKAIIRNDGTNPVTDLVVFINGELLNYSLSEPILPGELREITYNARQTGEDLEVIVIYNQGQVTQTVSPASVNTPSSGFTETPAGLNEKDLRFISYWDTTKTSIGSSNSTSITLPLVNHASSDYNFSVDWGDGSYSLITAWDSSNKTHAYASSGVYRLIINGTITGFSFNYAGDRLKILNITQWGGLKLGNAGNYFLGALNLKIKANDLPDLAGTTNMYAAFAASGIDTVNRMNEWDVSGVTDMTGMFYETQVFNQDIGDWDTSSVTNTSYMFYQAHDFNQDLGSWDVSSVVNMSNMFFGTYDFNTSINSWNTSKVIDMSYMFSNSGYNKGLNSWDTSSVTLMNNMFEDSEFSQPLDSWNTSKVENMSYMFSGYFNQSIDSWDTSSVTDMTGMFQYNLEFSQPLNSWNTSKVVSMNKMFSESRFNQSISDWDTSSVTDMSEMFGSNAYFDQDLSSWDVSKVEYMNYLFAGSPFSKNITAWNTSSATDMTGMFNANNNFNHDISSWDVSKVTTMTYMFMGAGSFNQNLSAWNVSSVTDMSQMFYGINLSTANYDALLIGWASLPSLQSGVVFDAGNSKYSSAATTARNTLATTYSWTITDAGLE